MIEPGSESGRVDRTRVEIEYLSGIDELDEPGAVRLEIDGEGMRISGDRTVRIDAGSIVGAEVVDASYKVRGKRGRASWTWWLAVGPLALLIPGKRQPDQIKHDYLLTIKYRSSGQVRSAVFHREDRLGLSMMEGLARILSDLVDRTVHGRSRG